ncbi:MAG: hypothetical protein RL154_479 [Pseudomonadota bacterium]|jgi:HEAT repeat protein
MALVKRNNQSNLNAPTFENLDDWIDYFQSEADLDNKIYALEQISYFDGSDSFFIELLSDDHTEPLIVSRIGAILACKPAEIAPIEKVMELLQMENAFVRNIAISVLRSYGEAIRYYIVKYLIGDDRDLRIFAINVLGDVNFKESREMLLELLLKEQDLNVAMTAVDYLGEIGQLEDIAQLESLKARFNNDAYVEFAVDNAVRSIKG